MGWAMSQARAGRRARPGRWVRALVSSPAVLAVLAMLPLAGCWPAPGFDADRTAHNPFETTISPATVGSLQRLWSTRLNTALVGPPVVVGDAVYADDALTVHRLDAATGARRWEAAFDLPPYPTHYEMGSPFVVGNRVLIGWGGSDGPGFDNGHWVTQWLDPATGAVVEEGPPGGQVEAVRGDRVLSTRQVLVPSSPDPQTALVVADGDRGSWSGLLGPRAAVTLGREHVYAAGPSPGAPGGAVSAFPVTGGRSDCGPSPDLPYACPIWTTPIEGVSGASAPVLGNGGTTLFVVTDTGPQGRGMLHALDAATGAVRWSVDVGSRAAYTPALADGRLFVPTASGRFLVVSAGGCGGAPTCQPLWSGLTPGGSSTRQPSVAGGVVFTTAYDSLNGFIYAFDARGCGGAPTCTSLWSAWVDGEPTGSPAISGGRLFVTTSHQEVIAYG
jgi:outer membrane protein assembly factor BamB